jgi:hypothetical protein
VLPLIDVTGKMVLVVLVMKASFAVDSSPRLMFSYDT